MSHWNLSGLIKSKIKVRKKAVKGEADDEGDMVLSYTTKALFSVKIQTMGM